MATKISANARGRSRSSTAHLETLESQSDVAGSSNPSSIATRYPPWADADGLMPPAPAKAAVTAYEDVEFSTRVGGGGLRDVVREWRRGFDMAATGDAAPCVVHQSTISAAANTNRLESVPWPQAGHQVGVDTPDDAVPSVAAGYAARRRWMTALVTSIYFVRALNSTAKVRAHFQSTPGSAATVPSTPSLADPWMCIYPRNKDGMPQFMATGKYNLRLFWQGAWRRVTVDDRVPVDARGQPLLLVSAVKNELWPLLLCKALFKLTGASLHSDCAYECALVHCLTGCVSLMDSAMTRMPAFNQESTTPAWRLSFMVAHDDGRVFELFDLDDTDIVVRPCGLAPEEPSLIVRQHEIFQNNMIITLINPAHAAGTKCTSDQDKFFRRAFYIAPRSGAFYLELCAEIMPGTVEGLLPRIRILLEENVDYEPYITITSKSGGYMAMLITMPAANVPSGRPCLLLVDESDCFCVRAYSASDSDIAPVVSEQFSTGEWAVGVKRDFDIATGALLPTACSVPFKFLFKVETGKVGIKALLFFPEDLLGQVVLKLVSCETGQICSEGVHELAYVCTANEYGYAVLCEVRAETMHLDHPIKLRILSSSPLQQLLPGLSMSPAVADGQDVYKSNKRHIITRQYLHIQPPQQTNYVSIDGRVLNNLSPCVVEVFCGQQLITSRRSTGTEIISALALPPVLDKNYLIQMRFADGEPKLDDFSSGNTAAAKAIARHLTTPKSTISSVSTLSLASNTTTTTSTPAKSAATAKNSAASAASAKTETVPVIVSSAPPQIMWKLRVTSSEGSTAVLVKDTEQEDRYKRIKAGWEAADAGRLVRAKEARDAYLKSLLPPEPVPTPPPTATPTKPSTASAREREREREREPPVVLQQAVSSTGTAGNTNVKRTPETVEYTAFMSMLRQECLRVQENTAGTRQLQFTALDQYVTSELEPILRAVEDGRAAYRQKQVDRERLAQQAKLEAKMASVSALAAQPAAEEPGGKRKPGKAAVNGKGAVK